MCINCKNSQVEEIFVIKGRGCGSDFDFTNIEIPLCKNCIDVLGVKRFWFNEKPIIKNGFQIYKYENEVKKLIFGINDIKLQLSV